MREEPLIITDNGLEILFLLGLVVSSLLLAVEPTNHKLRHGLGWIVVALTMTVFSWLLIASQQTPIPEKEEILEVHLQDGPSLAQQLITTEEQVTNANRLFAGILKPQTKVVRTVYKKIYWGVHFKEDTYRYRDHYQILPAATEN